MPATDLTDAIKSDLKKQNQYDLFTMDHTLLRCINPECNQTGIPAKVVGEKYPMIRWSCPNYKNCPCGQTRTSDNPSGNQLMVYVNSISKQGNSGNLFVDAIGKVMEKLKNDMGLDINLQSYKLKCEETRSVLSEFIDIPPSTPKRNYNPVTPTTPIKPDSPRFRIDNSSMFDSIIRIGEVLGQLKDIKDSNIRTERTINEISVYTKQIFDISNNNSARISKLEANLHKLNRRLERNLQDKALVESAPKNNKRIKIEEEEEDILDSVFRLEEENSN